MSRYLVGEFEAERIHARSVMRYVLYYFVDESANTVTVVDAAHSARETERGRWFDPTAGSTLGVSLTVRRRMADA